ncbi:unnamed protein product, partial [Discosporangium mesarthrocarpum]
VLAKNATLSEVESVDKLLGMIKPLLQDSPGGAEPPQPDDMSTQVTVEEEQQLVARLVHLMKSRDTDIMFRMLVAARRNFGQGATGRIQYTLVPLVFRALELVRTIPAAEAASVEVARQFSSRKVFQFLHEIITAMGPSFPWTSLTLFLQCAMGADRAGFNAISYEFFSQAFILYEDEVTDSKVQVRALVAMVGALVCCVGFDAVDYEALAGRTAQYAAKLLKKPDQCRVVTLCSHLFWVPEEVRASSSGRVL